MNKQTCQLLHTSDLHLRNIDSGASQSFSTITDLAVKHAVDLLIIAGDFFDYNAIDDSVVTFAIDQLTKMTCPTVILPGNHDYLADNSVYNRIVWHNQNNVFIFRNQEGETFEFQESRISIWGKPITVEDNIRPLSGIPLPHNRDYWHIAVAHGYYVDTEVPIFPDYHITYDEIVESGRDYIALGHVPVFRCACDEKVKAYYSGEANLCGTVNLISLGKEGIVQVNRIPTV